VDFIKVATSVEDKIIYTYQEFSIFKITANSKRFRDVVDLRQEHSDDTFDLHDNKAKIYVMYQGELSIGTIRVIELLNSSLDFETALPFIIKENLRQFICSASRLAITKRINIPKSVTNILIMTAAEDQFRQGVRFDLILCRYKLIHYYKRIGHKLLEYPPIIHPRTGTTCYLMLWTLTDRHTRLTNQYLAHLSAKLETEASTFLELV
jgi:hypothetical protein